MQQAATYGAWQSAAVAHDEITGRLAWREDDDSAWYDASQLRGDMRRVDKLRAQGDVEAVAVVLHESLVRHRGSLLDPALHLSAWSGSKKLVSRYLETCCDALTWLATVDVPGVPVSERRRRFKRGARNNGRSALMLSGGGTLGWIHLGVVKSLFQNGLLPDVISGASMGAMLAAGICTRTDAELAELVANPESIRLYGLERPGWRTSLDQRALLDPAVLLETIRHNCGDLTFEEAYQRTGRVLNMSVSPTRRGQRPRLLNHLTAPQLFVAESCLASSAIPLLFPPATLAAKGSDGSRQPFMTGERWVDGSMHEDLPKRRMARLHNINHFIVSQTNPHVLPFLSDPRRRTLASTALGLGGKAALRQGAQALAGLAQLTADTPLRAWAGYAQGLVGQDYMGDIDIHPFFQPGLLPKAFTNATSDEFADYMLLGERAAWPHLERIRLETMVGRTFARCLALLRTERAA